MCNIFIIYFDVFIRSICFSIPYNLSIQLQISGWEVWWAKICESYYMLKSHLMSLFYIFLLLFIYLEVCLTWKWKKKNKFYLISFDTNFSATDLYWYEIDLAVCGVKGLFNQSICASPSSILCWISYQIHAQCDTNTFTCAHKML